MPSSDTAAVIDRFNRAFVQHDASLLPELVADDCVMESIEPAPDGTRYEGGATCLGFWEALAADSATWFEPEEIVVMDDRAVIRWRYHFGDGAADTVRGVNIMRVRDGQIVEAFGYVKSGAPAVGDALAEATGDRR